MPLIFDKKDWIDYGRWVQPTLSGCFWCYWNETKSVREASGLIFKNSVFLDGHILVNKINKEKIAKMLKTICKNDNKIHKYIKSLDRIGQKYEKISTPNKYAA